MYPIYTSNLSSRCTQNEPAIPGQHVGNDGVSIAQNKCLRPQLPDHILNEEDVDDQFHIEVTQLDNEEAYRSG